MGGTGSDTFRRTLRFILDGELIELDDADPNRTVLQFLREDLRRTGTKEGCAEGDCGACTVVIVEADPSGERLTARAVNSCIQFLPTLDGKELVTVESLGGDQLHPAQQAMLDQHGSQCGFCTPGFIMSLFALYKSNPNPSRTEIDDALAGNLCRCTGYQPIVDAANKMYELAGGDDWPMTAAGAPPSADESKRAAALTALRDGKSLRTGNSEHLFFAPRTTAEMAAIVAEHPDATILAGGTDVGLWVTKQHREQAVLIYVGEIDELKHARVADGFVDIGAAATLSDTMSVVNRHFPTLNEVFLRFASPPIRNAGTLVGNVANGSPIGDSMPALIALGAEIVLRGGSETRQMPLEEFYVSYQVTKLDAGEFVERILVPLPGKGDVIRSYKVSKRFDQDISAVCGAYWLRRNGKLDVRIAYGGMAEIPKRASHCEQVLNGGDWSEASLQAALIALDKDFSPISDMRATDRYRQRICKNLLRRFWLESTGVEAGGVYQYGR